MQDRPDKPSLLDAVASFLVSEVRPKVDDPGVSFRLLVAAHVCAQVAAEVRHEDGHDSAELGRLGTLLDRRTALPATRSERKALFDRMNRDLAELIRSGAIDDGAVEDHLEKTLRDKLSVVNARFDLSDDPERGRA
jgi:hypothetical protein